ncbi:uncharacterized protein FN964_002775 isoform 2-T2 [Alca torda]
MGRLINANEPVAAAVAAGRRSRVTHWLPVTPRAAILLRGKEEEEEGTGARGDRALGLSSAVSDQAGGEGGRVPPPFPFVPPSHPGRSGRLPSGEEEEEEGGGPVAGARRGSHSRSSDRQMDGAFDCAAANKR